jgi:alpha-tubulin suppressor-like RCC1 family protein
MSAGNTHVAVLTTEGRVYTWGKNYDGQLGLGTTREYVSTVHIILSADVESWLMLISLEY